MNRYSPHYDYNEECARMALNATGDWVHINSVSAKHVEKLEAENARLRAAMIKARAWVTCEDNDDTIQGERQLVAAIDAALDE